MNQSVQLLRQNCRLVTNDLELLPLAGEDGLFAWYLTHHAKPASLRAKTHDLRRFKESLMESYGCREHQLRLGDVTKTAIEVFVEKCSETLQVGTVNRYLATVKHFCSTFAKHDPRWLNPAREVEFLKSPEVRYQGIDGEIAKELVRAAYETGTSMFIRFRAGLLAEFALATGLRAMELASIQLLHLTPDLKWVKGLRCKGGKIRNIYIPDDIRETLAKWLPFREDVILNTKDGYRLLSDRQKLELPLFPTLSKARLSEPDSFFLTYNGIYQVFRDIAKQAACGHVNPHRYRHAFAINLLDDCKDIRMVAQALGHSDVKTTMGYTNRGEDQYAAAVENAQRRRRA